MVHSRGGNSSALEAINTTFHKHTRHRANPNSTQFTLRHSLIQQYPGRHDRALKNEKKNRPMGYNNSDFSIHLMPRSNSNKCRLQMSKLASNLPGAESRSDRALMIIITCKDLKLRIICVVPFSDPGACCHRHFDPMSTS